MPPSARSTPPDVIKAIEAGKYVLCEKPLATTAEDCIAIMEAEQKAGKKLVTVGFMRRFDAAYNEMKKVLDDGENGQALLVHNRHRNPTVPESYTSRMAIDDTAIHEIDTMRWLLDEEIVKVRVERPGPPPTASTTSSTRSSSSCTPSPACVSTTRSTSTCSTPTPSSASSCWRPPR